MSVLTIILGVLLVLGGFFCFFTPIATFASLYFVVGIMLIVAGIGMIASFFTDRKKNGKGSIWSIIGGVLTIILGCLVLFRPGLAFITDVVLVYLFTSWLLVSSILSIAGSFTARKLGGQGWVWQLVLGIITLVISIYGFFHPLIMTQAYGFMIGFIIVMQGINLIAAGAMGAGSNPKDGGAAA